MVDTVVPSIPLAHAFGRIGCFLAGCCYGCESRSPIAVIFPEGAPAPPGVPLLPVQLIESAANFILFAALLVIGRKKRPSGRLSGLYLLSYSILRFFLEFFRGDLSRGVFLISLSQWISLPLAAIAIFLLFRRPETDFISHDQDV